MQTLLSFIGSFGHMINLTGLEELIGTAYGGMTSILNQAWLMDRLWLDCFITPAYIAHRIGSFNNIVFNICYQMLLVSTLMQIGSPACYEEETITDEDNDDDDDGSVDKLCIQCHSYGCWLA